MKHEHNVFLESKSSCLTSSLFTLALHLHTQQHPDKCPGDEAAKARFQALSVIHSVLSDAERRALYDESGELQEEDAEFNQANFDMW
jgi:DnaJ-class molecular chaperone